MKHSFDYYYGSQADQFSFIRIPRIMLTDAAFKDLSIQAKVLYGVLLDRMTLSRKNAWFDKENRVFIIYQIGEIQEDLGFTKKKAMDLLSELERCRLLEKKRRGHGLPNILYVKSFMSGTEGIDTSEEPEDSKKAEDIGPASGTSGIDTPSRGADFDTSGQFSTDSRSADSGTLEVQKSALHEVPKTAPLEVPILEPLKSYTYKNKTEESNIESNHIISPVWSVGAGRNRFDAMRSDTSFSSLAQEYRDLICENIEYDNLLLTFPGREELLEGIVDLILETVLSTSGEILIASSRFPAEIVKNKFLKLTYSHIRYVVDCLNANSTKVRNIKKYLLAALFNAPTTIDGYFTAEVNYDMAEAAAGR